MISEQLEEQASLYAVGALTARERTQFELVLEFHDEMRDFTNGLLDHAANMDLALNRGDRRPSAAVRDRIFSRIGGCAQHVRGEGFVLAGPDGTVQWVNRAFTAMCGYELAELSGKKLGPILQGELTDELTAVRVREAVRSEQSCTEALVNYHKNGTPYWVSLNITPLRDGGGGLMGFVAREVELTERAIVA